ncbi:MAG: DUF1176 domain-containing protein [Vibrio sp.]|uniref:DUF1176 domain-containing protein n=1 Tax=Vibrio sp. TaxID=678 RepID=UPI003A861497
MKLKTLVCIVTLLPLSFATAAFEPMRFQNKDWFLVCDNTGTCRATGYSTQLDIRRCELSIASRNEGWECTSERPLTVTFTREAGSNKPITASILWHIWEDGEESIPENVKLYVESDNSGSQTSQYFDIADNGQLNDEQIAAMLSVVRQNSIYKFYFSYTDSGRLFSGISYLSDKGATSIFRKMDEFQQRVGTPSAIIDKGSKSESLVKHPQLAPTIINRAAIGSLNPVSSKEPLFNYQILYDVLAYTPSTHTHIDHVWGNSCNVKGRYQLYLADLGNDYQLAAMDCLYSLSSKKFWLIDKNYQATLLDIDGSDYQDGKIIVRRDTQECWLEEERWVFDGTQFVLANSSLVESCRYIQHKAMPYRVSNIKKSGKAISTSAPNLLSPIDRNSIKTLIGPYASHEFALLKKDGTVAHSWGRTRLGKIRRLNDMPIWHGLNNANQLYATYGGSAYAALMHDGTVVTWGDEDLGGDSSSVQAELKKVKTIFPAIDAFAALKADGSVVAWGDKHRGGDASSVQGDLINVEKITYAANSFAAMRKDGSIVTWGDLHGLEPFVTSKDYVDIKATRFGYAALKYDGTVKVWGNVHYDRGQDSSALDIQLTDIDSIYSIGRAFAALRKDGTAILWTFGPNSFIQLTDVKSITGDITDLFDNKDMDFTIQMQDGSTRIYNQDSIDAAIINEIR